jgi:hypothetical protein
MKPFCLLLPGILMLALFTGCASFQEAYYIDHEFGQASQAAWDQQIVNKNQPYGDQPAEGLAGITAEEIIDVYNQTFAEKPTKTDVYTLEMAGNK